jgi:superfamily II DNA/RNA helicase
MLVVDEADMLLSGGFERQMKRTLATLSRQKLLDPHGNCLQATVPLVPQSVPLVPYAAQSPIGRTCVFAGATVPDKGTKSFSSWLRAKYPSMQYIKTDLLHREVESVHQEFVRLPPNHCPLKWLLEVCNTYLPLPAVG